ncbi:MAG: hypothetical protein AAB508_06965 [Patescibacteria group bacterium]
MKNFISTACLIGIFLFVSQVAEAAYVLPYPSYLPGNKLYKVSEFIDGIKKYWYFGTLTQLKYVQEMSDKHLVEAKTLFEYKQYALGVRALVKSNSEVVQISPLLSRLIEEKKSNPEIVKNVDEQMKSHVEVLTRMFSETPDSIEWTEERQAPRVINLNDFHTIAIQLRQELRNYVIARL